VKVHITHILADGTSKSDPSRRAVHAQVDPKENSFLHRLCAIEREVSLAAEASHRSVVEGGLGHRARQVVARAELQPLRELGDRRRLAAVPHIGML
jgi:hypothetical protein